MNLRPYQLEALEVSKRKLEQGVTRQLIALPTGTGKTVVFSNLLQHHGISKRLLVLVHRRELAEQARQKLRKYNKGVRVGIEMGDDVSWSGERIVIAGVQSVGRTGSARLRQFNPSEFGAVVCDEAHHSVASTYLNIFDHFGLLKPDNRILLLGVTATPVRGDGQGLDPVFQELVYSMPILKAIKDGWLSDLRAYRVSTRVNLDSVPARNGDFVIGDLERTVNTDLRNDVVVKTWFRHAENRQTVVFCVDIQHGKDLAEAFRREGVRADCVWGSDPERKLKLERHRRQEIQVLTNCGVLTEGYDDWRIGCILLARPTKSELLFMQMIGRGTRIPEGVDNLVEARLRSQPLAKEDCIVIDVVDSTRAHRLVTVSTIFGFDENHDLRGQRVSAVGRPPRPDRQPVVTSRPSVITNANSITTVLEEVDLFAPKWSDDRLNHSVLRWFRSGDTFILPLPDGGEVCIQRTDGWTAKGEINGQRFRRDGFRSFAEALAFGEKTLRYLGSDLLKSIESESRIPSNVITPLQAEMLRAVGDHNWSPRISRMEATKRIEKAYQKELGATPVQSIPEEAPVQSANAESAPDSRPLVIAQARRDSSKASSFPFYWKNTKINKSSLRWFNTDDHGYALPLPTHGEIFLIRERRRWLVSGEIEGQKIQKSGFDTLILAFDFVQQQLEQHGTELHKLLAHEADEGSAVTPLQSALLRNLGLHTLADLTRDDAQEVIISSYTYEYDPTTNHNVQDPEDELL